MREVLRLRLEASGYTVQSAKNGIEGLEKARRDLPDLVILDLMLPGISGEEVCKAIREDTDDTVSAIPILMLTARGTDADRIIGKVLGANAYITKPFHTEDLLATAERLCRAA